MGYVDFINDLVQNIILSGICWKIHQLGHQNSAGTKLKDHSILVRKCTNKATGSLTNFRGYWMETIALQAIDH